MSRWILFFITVAIGAAAGLYYGWVIEPAEYVDTTPGSLRADYKTDFVLMVAEAYQAEGDLPKAISRLSALGDGSPEESISNALVFAISMNPPYSQVDLGLMQKLAEAIQSRYSILESPSQ